MLAEEILTQSQTIRTPDPYASAHALLEWVRPLGNIVERANHLLASGPRTTCEISFTIEQKLDEFTHIHIEFDMFGDMQKQTLDVRIIGRSQTITPAPHGIVGHAFQDFYMKSIIPRLHDHTTAHAKNIASVALSFLQGTARSA